MTTLTATDARANLSQLLHRAIGGEDIGIIVKGKIVALRPVEVVSTDYVESEYGLKRGEWETVTRKLHEKGEKARKGGKAKRFTGNIEDAIKG